MVLSIHDLLDGLGKLWYKKKRKKTKKRRLRVVMRSMMSPTLEEMKIRQT